MLNHPHLRQAPETQTGWYALVPHRPNECTRYRRAGLHGAPRTPRGLGDHRAGEPAPLLPASPRQAQAQRRPGGNRLPSPQGPRQKPGAITGILPLGGRATQYPGHRTHWLWARPGLPEHWPTKPVVRDIPPGMPGSPHCCGIWPSLRGTDSIPNCWPASQGSMSC